MSASADIRSLTDSANGVSSSDAAEIIEDASDPSACGQYDF